MKNPTANIFKSLLIGLAIITLSSCKKTTEEINPALASKINVNNVLSPSSLVTPTEVGGWPEVFNPSRVLSLYLRMTKADWDVVRFDVTNTIEKPAFFRAEDETEIQVAVRRKSSRALPSEADPRKVGFKVSINRFDKAQRWNGLSKLSLENGSDVGPIAEGVAWNLYELASQTEGFGANTHAGLAAWVKVYIITVDGETESEPEYLGLYINVEQRDKQFLINRGLWTVGTTWLYEVDDINATVLAEGTPHSPTYNMLCFSPFQPSVISKKRPVTGACITPADAQLKTLLDEQIDMRAMLVQGAIDAYTANGDALLSHGKNFKFVDFSAGKRLYYPWDLDAVFGPTDFPIYGTPGSRTKISQNEYQKVILNHPQYRVDYNNAMISLLNGPLAVSALHDYFDAWKVQVEPALAADPYEAASGHKNFDDLKNWVSQRTPNVLQQVQANNKPLPR